MAGCLFALMGEMTDPYPTFLELQVVGEDTGHS